jgi:hypothetical protein
MMEIKSIFAALLIMFSLSFAYPPGQPGDKTCTATLESMVNYCEDYCTKMAGEICVLCETSASEKGKLDACSCQNTKRQHLDYYNISCNIPISEQQIPSPNITENTTNKTAEPAPIAPRPPINNITENKSSNITIITKKNETTTLPPATQDSGNAICLGPAAIAFLVSLMIIGRKRS